MRTAAAVAAIVLAASAAGAQTRAGTRMAAARVAGTYRIRICPVSCKPLRPPVTGYLVLLGDSLRTAALSDDVRSVMTMSGIGGDVPNACFAFDHVSERAGTRAGIQPVALTEWEPAHADSIVVRLYSSPDAGYHATFVLTNGVLRGVGRSWGGRMMERPKDERPDRVTGTRTGRADPTICYRAGRRAAARLDAMRDSAQ